MENDRSGASEVEELLKSWGYDERIISKFTEEEHTIKTLLMMSEYSVEKIFPKGGPRSTFIGHCNMYKEKNPNWETQTVIIPLKQTSSQQTTSQVMLPEKSAQLPSLVTARSSSAHRSSGTMRLSSSWLQGGSHVDESSARSSSVSAIGTSQLHLLPRNNSSSHRGSSLMQRVGQFTAASNKHSISEDKTTQPNKRVRTLNEVTESEIDALDSLLQSTPEGQIIMASFRLEGKLSHITRQKLGDEIIREVLRSDIEASLPDSKIDFWTKLILLKFPGEVEAVWAGSEKNRTSAVGRGILLCRYYNMRRKLVNAGVIRKSKLSSEPTCEEGDAGEDNPLEDLLVWLENHSRAVQPVVETWKQTSTLRVKRLRATKDDIDVLDKYSVLKLSDASTLICLDFDEHYPEASLKLFIQWPVLSAFILSKVTFREQEAVDDCFTPDGKKAKTIRLLHSLFVQKTVVCKKKKQWRPSRAESRDGLLQFVKTPGEIQTLLNGKRQRFNELGLVLPPQVFVVSRDEDTVDSCYVAVKNVVYNVENPMKALDVTFKAMHMLDLHYPKECDREMLFLQLGVYEFQTDSDKKLKDKYTTQLLEEYKRFREK